MREIRDGVPVLAEVILYSLPACQEHYEQVKEDYEKIRRIVLGEDLSPLSASLGEGIMTKSSGQSGADQRSYYMKPKLVRKIFDAPLQEVLYMTGGR